MTPCTDVPWLTVCRQWPSCPWVSCADRIYWCITWRGGIREIAPCNERRVLLDTPGYDYGAARPSTIRIYDTRQDALRALTLEVLDDSLPF